MNSWETSDMQTRMEAVHYDILKHPYFVWLASVLSFGPVYIIDNKQEWIKRVGLGHLTAATNGQTRYYYMDFVKPLRRKQLRLLVLHETLHMALHHCTIYNGVLKNRAAAAFAVDFAVNGLIREIDPDQDFAEDIEGIIYDKKYSGKSVIEIYQDLLKQASGGNSAVADMLHNGTKFDVHIEYDEKAEAEAAQALDPVQAAALKDAIEIAVDQGNILANRLRAASGTGGPIKATPKDRMTDWRKALRQYMTEAAKGTSDVRWTRINTKLYAASGGAVLLPTLYDEQIGDVVIAADTSASMGALYQTLFGEVAKIALDTKPKRIVLLWWDTKVAGVQYFAKDTYADIASSLAPAGGGGTNPQCAFDWVHTARVAVQCMIVLTDGEIGRDPKSKVKAPVLWGVLDNSRFRSGLGKVLHITST